MNDRLPNELYSCEQTRELDRKCIHEHGIAGIVLMKRAGRAAFEYASQQWPDTDAWLVLCGSGNNAGDGYIFAALAAQKRQSVKVLYLGDPNNLKGDAHTAYQYAKQEGVPMHPFSEDFGGGEESTVIVDALLGTGLQGAVRSEYLQAIEWMNSSPESILSLDIPSGLCGDTGAVLGAAVKASATITFIGCKLGLLTGRGPALTGELVFANLDVPIEAYKDIAPAAKRLTFHSAECPSLPLREVDAHKGWCGHLMVVGGDRGFGGAAIMAAEAAAFAGVSMVSLATRVEHVAPALARRPELMVAAVASGQELEPQLERPDFLVLGPGLGLSPWSEQMLQQALATMLPIVIDADALTILSKGRLSFTKDRVSVFTPHPGEAARMLDCSVDLVQQDRVAAIKKLQAAYGGVFILKGPGSLIFDGERLLLANVGNSGLATAGTGDILSGLIGAAMAQGLSAFEAAQYAVCLHGAAADEAVKETGVGGLLASELTRYVRSLMNTL